MDLEEPMMEVRIEQENLKKRMLFPRSFPSFLSCYININFLIASMKLLTNFENAYRNPPHNSLQCDWSKFTGLLLAVVKMRQSYKRLSERFYRITGGLLHAFPGHNRRCTEESTERIFEIT